MTVTAEFGAFVRGTYAGLNDLASVVATLGSAVDIKGSFSPGVAADQADKCFADSRNLAASATENLDLAGALFDPLGAALTFVKVKLLLIRAKATNTNNVIVGGAATNAFVGPFGANTHTFAIKPGGLLFFAAPDLAAWPVVAGTGDLLKITNGGAGSVVDYDVLILGTSA